MKQDKLSHAAGLVVEARLARRPLAQLPASCRVDDLEDAYETQDRANSILEARLGRRVGFKIGGTTESMRRYLKAPEPMGGEVFASTVHESGARLGFEDYLRPGIETEIAVRLARPLPARPAPYGREEVGEAIGTVMAAIELVDDRYEDFAAIGAPTLIADNVFNAACILGEELADWRHLLLDQLQARTFIGGAQVAQGMSDALLGHPLDALAWLANRRAAQHRGLDAGAFVSLGSITPVQWLAAPGTARIEVDGLGTVELTLV
ncbi:fumarylacetoacetate hydrolase family protein [Geminicoccaceae bacterium 1502E]|nr:fumarylacetoacetate hydrolase family protein [Geminicoccaceae bacterium 1502E]